MTLIGTRAAGTAAALGIVLMATACSSAEEDAGSAAENFYAALAARDGAAACSQLARRTLEELEKSTGAPCPQAVLEELAGAGAGDAEVAAYGEEARVRVGGDTAFLSLFPAGWRVVAAGCLHRPGDDAPYDCSVQGG